MMSPVVISTWPFGLRANEAALETLSRGGSSLDAVEQGVRRIEEDPEVTSVGYGGLPDERMEVTLDASIMDWTGRCGAVAALRGIRNAVSVARAVMEDTPHVLLVGEGAVLFAHAHGFPDQELLTERSRMAFEKWKAGQEPTRSSAPADAMQGPQGNHDTIGVLVLDGEGRLCGGVSTSGTAWKLPGRVGDSPIIGAGLFVDGRVGAAAATGVGEANMRIAGAHVVVEAMRRGADPSEACAEAVRRAVESRPEDARRDEFQLAFIALSRSGQTGSAAVRRGFQYARCLEGVNALFEPSFTYFE